MRKKSKDLRKAIAELRDGGFPSVLDSESKQRIATALEELERAAWQDDRSRVVRAAAKVARAWQKR